jgi:N-acetylneuraminic acid mutarotase
MQQAKRSCIFLFMLFSVYLTLLATHASAAENEWELAPPLSTPRVNLQVVEVEGKLYAIGGTGISGPSSVVEQFDPLTSKWTTKQNMNSPKSHFAATAYDNKIYAFSGTVVEEYNPIADTWSIKSPIPTAVNSPSAATLNGKIYIFSGNFVQEYDPVNDSWSAKNNSDIDLSSTVAVSLNGKIHVLGGTYEGLYSYSYSSNRSLSYDPVTDQWSELSGMQTPRTQFGAEVVNGKIFVFGGDTYYRHPVATSDVGRYDPATNTWTSLKNIPSTLYGHDTALLGDRIYAIGGISYDSSIGSNTYTTKSYVYSASPSPEQLERPTGVTAAVYDSEIILKWAPVLNATGYLIKRSEQPGGPYLHIGGVVSSTYGHTVTSATYSYSDTAPFAHSFYYYTVSAINSIGQSDNSNEILAIIPPVFNEIQTTSTGIGVTWITVPDAIKYTVKRSTTPGGPYATIGTLDPAPFMNVFEDSNLQLGITYYYVVSMTTSAGESTNSREVSGALQSVTPTQLTAAVQPTQVSLTWTGAYQAQTYIVKRATKSGGPYSTIASGITGTAYSDTNVQSGVTYYYIVTAIAMGHESDSSNEASATIPSSSSTGGILKITMEEGTIKTYQVDSAKLHAFIDWFESRAYGIGPDAFGLDKGPDGSYSSIKHYILFHRIITFEVDTLKP